jgi:DnaJ-class molecular chaperone
MKDELKELLSGIELETKCDRCFGKGRWIEEGSGRPQSCCRCNGSGYAPTEVGAKILNLVSHNLKGIAESAGLLNGE